MKSKMNNMNTNQPENATIEKLTISGMSLNELSLVISEDNRKKGFYEDDDQMKKFLQDAGAPYELFYYYQKLRFAQRVALMHSELSESLEADRKDLLDDHLKDMPGREVELADALIRILDCAGAEGIDIETAVERKLNYNRTRAYKHGKKY